MSAIDQLLSMLQKLDGEPNPPDWMVDSVETAILADDINLMIDLLMFAL